MSALALVFNHGNSRLLALVNAIVDVSVSMYIRGYWKAKAEIPFLTEYNEAIRKSNDLRRLLIALSAGWAIIGAVGYLSAER